jgi:hypothetical protein
MVTQLVFVIGSGNLVGLGFLRRVGKEAKLPRVPGVSLFSLNF